jgi:hypothetical protein
MAEFKLERIRFSWVGDWIAATLFRKDDIVRYGGKSYVCLVGHTSSSNFYTDLNYVDTASEPDIPKPKWVLWFDGYEFRNNWTGSTLYNLGDIVRYGSLIYVCNESHTSDPLGLEYTLSKWVIYAIAEKWGNAWLPLTNYKVNDIVKISGNLYRCNTTHVSASTISTGVTPDIAKWDVVSTSENWQSNWIPGARYEINSTVRYGGIVYSCVTGHAAAATDALGLEADIEKWTVIHAGIDHKGIFALAVRYKLNDTVKYGANVWICTAGHTSVSTFDPNNWAIYIPGNEYVDQWTDITQYVPGDIVRYGGYSYTCLNHNLNVIPYGHLLDWRLLTIGFKVVGNWDNVTTFKTGDLVRRNGRLYVANANTSSQEPTTNSVWTLVVPGDEWHKVWVVSTAYAVGDIVDYASTLYRCILAHIALNLIKPSIDNTYWERVIDGDPRNPLTYAGDTVSYNLDENIRTGIGQTSQLFKSEILPYFGGFGEIGYIYYVSPSGVDDPSYGKTLDLPFKTIKYACDFVKAGTQNQNANFLLTSNRAWVLAEMYQWMLYQKANNISPFTVSSVIDQSKTIRDASIIFNALSYDISRGGNSQLVTNTYAYFQPGTNLFFNTDVANDMPYIIAALTKMISLIQDAVSNSAPLQSYQLLNGVTVPALQVINPSYPPELGINNLITTLSNILINALTTQTTSNIPKITGGLDATIFIKTGTYYENTPIIVPADTALVGDELHSTIVHPAIGNELVDMFRVRNGTGIRNMSLKGLSGTLGPANQYLTKRPSAGAYVSLDGGAGPADSSTWITTRSPYIQNVTNFGVGCVGLKIDGNLHGGGNKSIVANDFTQVLSDGIGVWCTGSNALVELVSVFSYYGHIGYLAENGGRIRATNGNSSYGNYGTVAEGYDLSETPQLGTINNRTQEAQVASVVAGESQNKIILLEYLTAGQNYTAAAYSFAGSGTGAIAVADEFRDRAIFENKIYGTEISAGGDGYSTASNHAQTGDATTITIASNDTNLAVNYVGMRIILTSGTGVGQYGYIQAYDEIGKVATVYNEQTGLIGWNHMIPGTVILSELDATTVYNIEPRVTFSTPLYSSTAVTLPAASWTGVVYGNGKFVSVASFSNAAYSTDGTTWSVGSNFPSLISPTVAYTNGIFVSVNATTTSYAFSNDGITWDSGTFSTGASYSNVIAVGTTFVVVSYSTTELLVSSNGVSWAPVAATGIQSGKIAYGASTYVSFASGSTNAAAYSTNGTTWTSVTLPTTATWASITYGNGRFIAIATSGTSVVYSLDGITWVASAVLTAAAWTSIAYGQGVFVAVATGTNTIATTQDGIVWITRSILASNQWSAVAFGNPSSLRQFIAVATAGSSAGRQILAGAQSFGRAVIASGKIGSINIWEPGSGYSLTPTVVQFVGSISNTTLSVTYVISGALAAGLFLGGGRGNISANTSITTVNNAVFTGFISNTSLTIVSIVSGTVTFGMVIDNGAASSGTTITGTITAVFTGSITGTTLTVTGMTSGVISAGMVLTGGAIPAEVFIVSNIAGAGINSTWLINTTVSQSSTLITGTKYTVENGQINGSPSLTVTFNAVNYTISLTQTVASANMFAYTLGSAVVTLTAPDAITTVIVNCRTADGVLGNPSFTNRGNNYQTSTTSCTISGNGFADIPSISKYVYVSGLDAAPSPGASIAISGNSTQFKIVNITLISTGTYYFQIAPALTRMTAPVHATAVEIRQKYSQVRLTGHDFLLIGTGNKESTNFPNTDITLALQAYQVQENNQGRVFVTATDQDGNFKVGGQFAVQQATGIVTISADLFNLAGLNQITLGGVQIGQNTVTITQFSTDSYFTANSDNIVPTQKAIKSYLARLISSGGANAMTSILTAGTVGIGPQRIFSSSNDTIVMNNNVNFTGGIAGTMLALQYFMQSPGSTD